MKSTRLFLAQVGYHSRLFPLVTPPIGLMALAAYLRERMDVDVRIVNQRLDNCTIDQLVSQAVEHQADIVGLSAFTTTAYLLPEATRKMREALPDALIIVGGPHASAAGPKSIENTDADAAVAGEGEQALEQVIQARQNGEDLSGIPGLIRRGADGEIVQNPGHLPFIEDLDSLPMPAYDLIDITAYWAHQSIAPIVHRKYVSLVSSRGCPYNCIWCHNIFGKRIRKHSAERIVEEIDFLKRTYGVTDFEFLDDNFNFDAKRVVRFSELMNERNLKVRLAYPTALRGDRVTQEVVDALVDAGMYLCGFSLETGSPRLQKYTCKYLDIDRFIKGVEMTANRHVYIPGFCMMGFPTETEAELQKTIDVACACKFHTVSFFTVTPFPGTPLYDMAMETHPDKLANLCYDNMDFSAMNVNLTDLPDETLFAYQRKALRSFFLNPNRIGRLIRDYPQPHLLPTYLPIFLHRITKGLFGLGT